jgi:hypothetical protein
MTIPQTAFKAKTEIQTAEVAPVVQKAPAMHVVRRPDVSTPTEPEKGQIKAKKKKGSSDNEMIAHWLKCAERLVKGEEDPRSFVEAAVREVMKGGKSLTHTRISAGVWAEKTGENFSLSAAKYGIGQSMEAIKAAQAEGNAKVADEAIGAIMDWLDYANGQRNIRSGMVLEEVTGMTQIDFEERTGRSFAAASAARDFREIGRRTKAGSFWNPAFTAISATENAAKAGVRFDAEGRANAEDIRRLVGIEPEAWEAGVGRFAREAIKKFGLVFKKEARSGFERPIRYAPCCQIG